MLKHLPSAARLAFAASTLCLLVSVSGCSRDPNVRKHKYLDSGKRYEKDGKNKEAIIQFSNALKVDHDFADAHFELGKTYLKMGSGKAAYGELARTVALDPKNVPARVELANIYLAGNAPDRANDQVKAILALDPNNADAYEIMAGIAARKGDKVETKTDLDRAVSLDPNRAVFHTNEALMDARSAEMPEAESELEKAVALDPKQTSAHLMLAGVLEKKGDRQGAEQQDLAAIKETPASLRARASLAGLYVRGGDQAKGEQVIRQAAVDTEMIDPVDRDRAAALLSQFYVATKQPDKAEPAYADLVAKDPKNIRVKIVYAGILLSKHETDKAAPILADLTKSSPNDPTVERYNAGVLIANGKLDAAVDTLQKAAKSSPQDGPIQLALAQAALRKGDVGLATTAFQTAAKIMPKNALPTIGLANIAAANRDYSMLMQLAQQTIAKAPKFPDAYLWRGTAEENGDTPSLDKAAADFDTAMKLSPSSPGPMLAMAQLRLKQNKVAEATPLLESALQKDPNSVQGLGMLLSTQKDPAKAVALIQQQIAKSPQNPVFYDFLARADFGTRDFAGARDAAGKAVKLAPEFRQATMDYATAQTALGDKDGAINTWKQWSDAHPKDASATASLGVLEDSKGDKAKAEEYYKKSLQQEPSQVVSANNLAYMMVANNEDLDAALTLAQTARRIARSPQDVAVTADTLAWVYYKKGRYGIAKDQLEDVAKTAPADAAMQYHLGMIYSKLGDKAQASIHLKKAQSLDPNGQNGKDATAALAQLG